MPKGNQYARTKGSSNFEEASRKDRRFIYRISKQDESPLFMLPTELRAIIWRLVLPSSEWIAPNTNEACGGDGRLNRPVLRVVDSTSPLILWSRGSFELLRVCKRVHVEATRIFYTRNSFECIIEGIEPYLSIMYGHSASPSQEPQWQPHAKPGMRKLRTIRREHCELVSSWVLSFPTHLGIAVYLEQELFTSTNNVWLLSSDTTEEVMQRKTERRQEDIRCPKKQYREQVLFGLDRWLQLSGAIKSSRRFNQLELRFFPYRDLAGKIRGPDEMLKTRVFKNLPRCVLCPNN